MTNTRPLLAAALIAGCAVISGASSARAASCVPGFDFAAFGKDGVKLSGGAATDSFNSDNGPYGAPNAFLGGNLGTNGTSSGSIDLNGSSTTVGGNITYGSTGTSSTASAGTATVTGTTSPQTTNTPLPSVILPSPLPNGGLPGIDESSTVTLAPGTYRDVKGTSGGAIHLSAGTYVMRSLSLAGNSSLVVDSAPVLVYIDGGQLDLSGGSTVNPAQVASDLVFMVVCPASGACPVVKVSGGTTSAFAVYAPDSDVAITGGSDLYGAVIGKTVTNSGGTKIHYDTSLSDNGVGQFTCPETSRSAPVVAYGDGTNGITFATGSSAYVVQGSFQSPGSRPKITTLASISAFKFPYIQGHMRARLASTIAVAGSSFASGVVLFDAGAPAQIPPAAPSGCTSKTGTCRNVFTVTTLPDPTTGIQVRPAPVPIDDSHAAAIGPLFTSIASLSPTTAHYQQILRIVAAGGLGGVDRSTVAVIPPSGYAGVPTRPTMAYFGATDGMLHAVCVTKNGTTPSASGICSAKLGVELWAFMPRTQVALVPSNTTRIDGSIRVVDMFGDFNSPATGKRAWRTILFFQTGFATAAAPPATYAVDVTDPASPVILWERTTRTTGVRSPDFGTGLTVAAGQARFSGNQLKNVAVIQTANGGLGGPGVFVTAAEAETGAALWPSPFGYLYGANGVGATGSTTASPRGVAADAPVAATGIPGGAVGVDLRGQGGFTDFVFGDLYGDVWRVSAADGTSRNGPSTPLFSFSTNRHPIGVPPAIYGDGTTQFAAFASGGYTDQTAGAQWTTPVQYLIAARLSGTGATTNETAMACTTCTLAVNRTFSSLGIAGDHGFAQALVVGTQLLLSTDSSDPNTSGYGAGTATGHVTTMDLTGVAPVTVVTTGAGGASLVNSAGVVYSSSGAQQQQLAAASSSVGVSVDSGAAPRLSRLAWLRTQ